MNKDERDGKVENLKGRAKEAAGIVSGDEELEKEGAEERAAGEARRSIGEAHRKVGEALEDLGKKIER
jgi:uncharacterized protein YjbJ (UPF0337 family)